MSKTGYCLLVLLFTELLHGATSVAAPREISVPSGDHAGEPHLSTAPDGSVILSWLERKAPESDTYALKFARRSHGTWSAPRVVVERDDLFVNWADFPSVVAGAKGLLFAHWLQKSGADTYAYDVRLATSRDDGRTWSKSATPHRDGTKTEHGFVSLVPRGDSVAAVWLDGRNMKSGGHHDEEGAGDMTIRYALIGTNGKITSEAELDRRTCECCQTGMAFSDLGPLVVYRDRSPNEVRDAYVLRKIKGKWSAPGPIHRDEWKVDGCPVNGPQVDARGKTVVVAWFTAAKERNQVFVTFSQDSGATFARPIAVADSPLGRVDIVLLPDQSAIVSWIEQVGTGAEVRARRVTADGKLDPPIRVGVSSPARSAGVPRMTLAGREVYLAWTEVSQPARIRIAVLPLSH